MGTKEILSILKTAANLVPEVENGHIYGSGFIAKCPECESMSQYEYSEKHYPKMVRLLESLPWTMTVERPRMPRPEEYPKQDGQYITMLDCNEHEVLFNTFRNGCWTLYHETHVKWWMPVPDDIEEFL